MVLDAVVHLFAARVDVHLDAVPRGVIIIEGGFGLLRIMRLQRVDGAHQCWANRLDAGDFEPFSRGCLGSRRSEKHYRGGRGKSETANTQTRHGDLPDSDAPSVLP